MDPEYTYIRGEGWVPLTRERRVVTFAGKKYVISIERRDPRRYERGWNVTGYWSTGLWKRKYRSVL